MHVEMYFYRVHGRPREEEKGGKFKFEFP